MKFKNADDKPVEINFQNFEQTLPENKPGLSLVKFKDGQQEWSRATRDEILEATAENSDWMASAVGSKGEWVRTVYKDFNLVISRRRKPDSQMLTFRSCHL